MLVDNGTQKPVRLNLFEWHILEDSFDMAHEEVLSDEDLTTEDVVVLTDAMLSLYSKLNSEEPWALRLDVFEEHLAQACLKRCVFFKHDLHFTNDKEREYKRAAVTLQKKFSVGIPR